MGSSIETLELPAAEELQPHDAPTDVAGDASDPSTSESAPPPAVDEEAKEPEPPDLPDEALEDLRIRIEGQKRYIVTLASALRNTQDDYDETKNRLAELKADLASTHEQIIEASRTLQSMEWDLKAPGKSKPPGSPIPAEPSATDPSPAASPEHSPAAGDDSWRSVSLDSLGLAKSIVEALRENPTRTLATMGDLCDWTAGGKALIDVPRIGEGKAEKIQAALDAFWVRWRGQQDAAAEAPRADGETVDVEPEQPATELPSVPPDQAPTA